jgi:NAD(P)-dependent dehydrogenase (short-subunit alcohol dehydrogenase family)
LRIALALISGAARGIGEAEARAVIEAGANVVLGDLLDEPWTRLADDLNGRAVKTVRDTCTRTYPARKMVG